MESLGAPISEEISQAIVVWTGWGRTPWPKCDERRLAEYFGNDKARDLAPIVRRLKNEFYESDARLTVADLAEMADKASARFRELHPELSEDAIGAFAWCYSFDFK